jgi:hypothetical protein
MDFTMSRTLIAFLLTACLAFSGGPTCEVASITPCEPGTPAPEWAYWLQPSQHSKGLATADYDATENEEKLMVQSLLADRFR